MEERDHTATLSKLISREKFYKEKALKLERESLFAKDQIVALETRVNELTQALSDALQTDEVDTLNDQLKQATSKLKEKEQAFNERQETLLKEIEELKAVSHEQTLPSDYQDKISGYEALLTDIQKTINEKERECIVLRKRIETLEKRLKKQHFPLSEDPSLYLKKGSPAHTFETSAISYIDHAIILSEETCIIRGDCVIKNMGERPLETPIICFRIEPFEATSFKGKFLADDILHESLVNEDNWQWSTVQNEWSEEAKERGEIWIAPTHPISLAPNQEIKLSDIQFLVQSQFLPRLTIECFVYFGQSSLKIKALNSIIVNF